jgi:hypothetical protein
MQTGAFGDVASPQMGVLIGDTTGNGAVNSSDIAQTQSQSGQAVTSSNFREDVTANGAITAPTSRWFNPSQGPDCPAARDRGKSS